MTETDKIWQNQNKLKTEIGEGEEDEEKEKEVDKDIEKNIVEDDDDDGDEKKEEEVAIPFPVVVGLLFGYLFIGALLFKNIEGYTVIQGLYFCFVTLATIGFGGEFINKILN
jgi:hypothetical protein